MNLEVCRPDKYDHFSPREHTCLVCQKIVQDESHLTQKPTGEVVPVYSPSSRYYHNDGVFCSVECGILYLNNS